MDDLIARFHDKNLLASNASQEDLGLCVSFIQKYFTLDVSLPISSQRILEDDIVRDIADPRSWPEFIRFAQLAAPIEFTSTLELVRPGLTAALDKARPEPQVGQRLSLESGDVLPVADPASRFRSVQLKEAGTITCLMMCWGGTEEFPNIMVHCTAARNVNSSDVVPILLTGKFYLPPDVHEKMVWSSSSDLHANLQHVDINLICEHLAFMLQVQCRWNVVADALFPHVRLHFENSWTDTLNYLNQHPKYNAA